MQNHDSYHDRIDPAKLGFDLDGVIADTANAFIRLACTEHGYCSFTLDDITNFELEGCIDMPAELVAQIFDDILRDSLSTGLQPMEGAVEVLGELAAHSPVTVITARHLERPVIDWFDNFFPRATREAITLIAMGDHDDKLRHIREQQLEYFIDDRAETCNFLAASGIRPLVYSHPWNRDRHNLPTVENWKDIRKIIEL